MDRLAIEYRFQAGDDQERTCRLELDARTLELNSVPVQAPQDWTCLRFCQCPNCPLDEKAFPRCPVAANLEPLIGAQWAEMCSYTDVYVEVVTAERTVSAQTKLQRGMSSLLGLIMATSPCPHTRFLRPMARFHLPLATEEETIYRAASMHLLRQYYRYLDGKAPDLDLEGLKRSYQNLHVVNNAIAQRIRQACEQDTAVNAVVLLDLLAKNLPYSIDDSLQEIRYLFESCP